MENKNKITNEEAIGILSGLKMRLDTNESVDNLKEDDKKKLMDVISYSIATIEHDESYNLSPKERNAIRNFIIEIEPLVTDLTEIIHRYEDDIPNFRNMEEFTLQMKKDINEPDGRCLDGDFMVEVYGELPAYTDIEYDQYTNDIFVFFERYIKSKHESFIK